MSVTSPHTYLTGVSAITGGQLVVKALEDEGVEAVFGIPGVYNLPIYDALMDNHIAHHLPRHEQGAGFMADGYYRCSGRVGVTITTTGPGAINSLTALANAYSDSSPILLITTAIPPSSSLGHTGMLHELKDQRGVLASSVTAVFAAERVEQIPAKLQEALQLARGGRPRPVVLEIPFDILEQKWDLGSTADASLELLAPSCRTGVGLPPSRNVVLTRGIRRAAEMLHKSTYPLIYAGEMPPHRERRWK